MKYSQNRYSAEGYSIQVLTVNGIEQQLVRGISYRLEDICKGGFRFISDLKFEIEDRLQVLLIFPSGYTQKVLGRICYSETIETQRTAYGFSILQGFYSLQNAAA